MAQEKLISEFNEAAFQISRIHNTWLEIKSLRESGNLIKCKFKLDSIAAELWNDAERLDEQSSNKKKEKNEITYISEIKKIDNQIHKSQINRNLPRFYFLLLEKEKLLRKIQEKSGKGAKYRIDDGISNYMD